MQENETPNLSNDELWKILSVTKQLCAAADLDAMLERVINLARDVLDAERGTVFLYDMGTDSLVSRVATGNKEIRVPQGVGIVGECATTQKIVNVTDCYSDTRFNQEVDKATGYLSRCLIAIPLIGVNGELVGVLQVLNKRDGVFHFGDCAVASVLASQCAVALQRTRWLQDYVTQQKRNHDLMVAREIQQDVFPKQMPDIEGYDIAAWNRPADETGGDVYDAVSLDPSRSLLLLGDATGHGIGPALSVTQMRSMIRMAIRFDASLDDIVKHLNNQLAADLSTSRFITAIVGILDSTTHKFEYHAPGQGPLLFFHYKDQSHDTLDASAVPLGILENAPLTPPEPFVFQAGDFLAVMSDGFFEYPDEQDELFGEDRVVNYLMEHRDDSAEKMVSGLVEEIAGFAQGAVQNDDMTIFILKRSL
jgi:phosphoserine phosphatase